MVQAGDDISRDVPVALVLGAEIEAVACQHRASVACVPALLALAFITRNVEGVRADEILADVEDQAEPPQLGDLTFKFLMPETTAAERPDAASQYLKHPCECG